MKVFTEDELILNDPDSLLPMIRSGAIFVYPTDTIYGIGCDATNEKAVRKIRELKGRETKPFSIIIPKFDWIYDNCFVSERELRHLANLPGAYTFILHMKKEGVIAPSVTSGKDTVGVRIPDHWISLLVEHFGRPIVTTSVNISGEPFATKILDIDEAIRDGVTFAIDCGELAKKPSQVVDLSLGHAVVVRK